MKPTPRRSRLAALLGLALVVSACGSAASPSAGSVASLRNGLGLASASVPGASPSALSSGDLADQTLFAQIESQVEGLRSLNHKSAVTPVLLDSNQLRNWLTNANATQTDHVTLANESRLFIHLGLLPSGSSLEQMELDLQAGQVIGFYDTASKGLYVLSASGGVGPLEEETFSHEYTHALQDQNFGLDKLATDTPDQGDRDLARLSLPEGDATMVMNKWAEQHLSLADQIGIATDPNSAAAAQQLAKAPAILRQTLLFPYIYGNSFVMGVYAKGGWAAVDKLYSNPPASTSQILHPELYAAGVAPVAVTLPAMPASLGSGWTLTLQDTLGELQLRILLEGEHPTDAETTTAATATAAWGGDRVGLYEGPGGAWAVVLRTNWRNADGAAAFRSAIAAKAAHLTGSAKVCPDAAAGGGPAQPAGTMLYLASDAATLAAFANC
jgi:hypothetical protein